MKRRGSSPLDFPQKVDQGTPRSSRGFQAKTKSVTETRFLPRSFCCRTVTDKSHNQGNGPRLTGWQWRRRFCGPPLPSDHETQPIPGTGNALVNSRISPFTVSNTVCSSGDFKTRKIQAPTFFISSCRMPRVVNAAVPIRIPLGSIALR